jgi:RNA polymerase sigma-70 factor (ECF subfamily)
MSAEHSDEELLASAAAGEQQAIGELYDRYQGLTYGMALRITGDRALAQDVLQEVFLGVWRHAGRYDAERASARTWILSIAHHRAIDYVRRRAPVDQLPTAAEGPTDIALTAPEPWPEVARDLEAGAVRDAVDHLPAAQREVIQLAYFSGLTQQEISTRTDAPLGTIKGRARIGLERLRRSLTGEGFGSDDVRAGWLAADSPGVLEERR